mgnify:CR=1 FL=1
MSWSTYQTDVNLFNEREQVGNFVPDEDHATGVHAGISRHCLFLSKSYVVSHYESSQSTGIYVQYCR